MSARHMAKPSKKERQNLLLKQLGKNPFATDAELARQFGVSKQTIRLDRLALSIPEVRERVKLVARQVGSRPRNVSFGELMRLEPGSMGISTLLIGPEMVSEDTNVVEGYYLFAQAHALATTVVDAPLTLTASARVRYRRPVYLGEEAVARATVKVRRGMTQLVSVHTRVEGEIVFKGHFVILGAREDTARADSR